MKSCLNIFRHSTLFKSFFVFILSSNLIYADQSQAIVISENVLAGSCKALLRGIGKAISTTVKVGHRQASAAKVVANQIAKPYVDFATWYSGGQLKRIPAEAMNIFEARYQNEKFKLSEEQREYLESNGLYATYEYFENSPPYGIPFIIPSQFWSMYRAQKFRANPIDPKLKVLKWAPNILKSLAEIGALALFPPALVARLALSTPARWAAEYVYNKILKDPDYVLSEADRKIISGLSLGDDVERYRSDARIFKTTFEKSNFFRRMKRIALGFLVGAALLSVSTPTQTISAQSSLDEKSPNGMSRYDNKVELIFLHPLPHVSIRIGGVIYNFSTGTVQKLSLKKYIQNMGFGDLYSGSHTRVELNLTDDERRAWIEALDKREGQAYLLVPPFNDCVSQTNHSLHEVCPDIRIAPLANRSEALTIAQFRAMKFFGSDRVKKIIYADNEKVPSQKYFTLGATWAEIATFAPYVPYIIGGGEIFDAQGAPSWEPKTQRAGESKNQ